MVDLDSLTLGISNNNHFTVNNNNINNKIILIFSSNNNLSNLIYLITTIITSTQMGFNFQEINLQHSNQIVKSGILILYHKNFKILNYLVHFKDNKIKTISQKNGIKH